MSDCSGRVETNKYLLEVHQRVVDGERAHCQRKRQERTKIIRHDQIQLRFIRIGSPRMIRVNRSIRPCPRPGLTHEFQSQDLCDDEMMDIQKPHHSPRVCQKWYDIDPGPRYTGKDQEDPEEWLTFLLRKLDRVTVEYTFM